MKAPDTLVSDMTICTNGNIHTVGLERINSGHVVTCLGTESRAVDLADTRLDGTTVDDDSGSVDASSGHDTCGHVLVASWDRDVGIVVLSLHNSLDGVGNEITTR